MNSLPVLACAGLMAVGLSAAAGAQTSPTSGGTGSPFPLAAPHEVVTINGVACRTVLNQSTNTREVVSCAEPVSTGSLAVPAQPGAATGAPPAGADTAFPLAAPHEVVNVNGVACRTVLNPTTNTREVVACAR